MLEILKAEQRGVSDFGWLDSRHSFSFGEYHDPARMGFRSLRVLNDDRVAAGAGFPRHGHRDMEILSWVLEGGLTHKDSLGTGSTIRPGDLQKMSAGTGVQHSEFNASASEPAHFLQVWIVPERTGLAPGYEQKHFDENSRSGVLKRIASGRPVAGEVKLFQDVDLYASILSPGQTVGHPLKSGRHAWLQVARGVVTLGDSTLREGDGVAASAIEELKLRGVEPAEILLFDLA